MDESTRKEIRRITAETLRNAGLTEPPLSVERLLEHVELYREYYDLSEVGFLDRAKYKLQIHGRRLVEVLNKVRLHAVLLFDEKRICIDNDLPKIKRPWASCHETGHRILTWHKPFSTPTPPRPSIRRTSLTWRKKRIMLPPACSSSAIVSRERRATFSRQSMVSSASRSGTAPR